MVPKEVIVLITKLTHSDVHTGHVSISDGAHGEIEKTISLLFVYNNKIISTSVYIVVGC